MAEVRTQEAIARVRAWGEARDWRGYDPYDALNSPLAPVLTLGTRLGRRLLTQAVKRSPVNLRPVLGIRPERNAMAIAAVALGYARLSAATADHSARTAAIRWLDWLVGHRVGRTPRAWGYHFPVETRFFFYPRHSPNTIATSFAVFALVEGRTLLTDSRWDPALDAAGDFLVEEMLEVSRERSFFRYVPGDRKLIHNANVLACAALTRISDCLGRYDLRAAAADAVVSTVDAQRDDGSWPYAETGGSWVDNFHTGYVLEALAACQPLAPEVRDSLRCGIEFWERELFFDDARPKLTAERPFPLDAQCYAQAVETWLAVADVRPDAAVKATVAAARLVSDMLAPDGHVYFQRHRGFTSKTAFVRWSTAPAFSALARLMLAQAGGTQREAALAGRA